MSIPDAAALLIRPATEADAPAIQAIYAPIVRDTAISFEDVPPTVAEIAERVRATLPTYPYLVCETQDGVLGFAYAGAHRARAAYRWSVDVTVYVDAAAHRQGIGLALYRHLIGILERQGFHAAFAGIALPNPNSVGLHEALGFVHLGTYAQVGFKLGAWRDVGWWRRPLAAAGPETDPIPFSKLPPADAKVVGKA